VSVRYNYLEEAEKRRIVDVLRNTSGFSAVLPEDAVLMFGSTTKRRIATGGFAPLFS